MKWLGTITNQQNRLNIGIEYTYSYTNILNLGFLYDWYHNYIPCSSTVISFASVGRRVKTRLPGRSATLPVEDLRNRRDLCVDSLYIYTPFVIWTYHYILCFYHYISCVFYYIYIIILISIHWVPSIIHRSEQIVGLMIIIYPKLHQHQRQKIVGDFLEDEASNSLGVVVWFKECALVIFYATVGIGDSFHEGGMLITHRRNLDTVVADHPSCTGKISPIPGQTSP
jgi:hypothetical protein